MKFLKNTVVLLIESISPRCFKLEITTYLSRDIHVYEKV